MNKPHVDSGWKCLLDHGPEGPCIRCAVCDKLIRPKNMNEPCPKNRVDVDD